MTGKAGHMCRWTKMEKLYTLMAGDYKDPPAILTETAKPSPEGNKKTIFVMDRASFNAGEKAQFPPQIHEGGAVPCLIAKGTCAVCYEHNVTIRKAMGSK